MICACGKDVEPGKAECFRCRVASVGYVWRGGGHLYGRASFSERTNAEFINEHVGGDVKAKLRSGEISPSKDFG